MTLEDFRKTKKPMLRGQGPALGYPDPEAEGFTYLGSMVIEETRLWKRRVLKKYYLMIERGEWLSDDLAKLEQVLWEYAVDTGVDIPGKIEKIRELAKLTWEHEQTCGGRGEDLFVSAMDGSLPPYHLLSEEEVDRLLEEVRADVAKEGA